MCMAMIPPLSAASLLLLEISKEDSDAYMTPPLSAALFLVNVLLVVLSED